MILITSETFSIQTALDPSSMFGMLTLAVLSVTLTIQPREKKQSPRNRVDELLMKQRFEPRGFARK